MHQKSVRFQLAMALALITAVFPMSVALAQGEQKAEQVAGSLLSQLTGMDVGQVTLHKGGGGFTVTRPDGSSLEFTNVVRHPNGVSGAVSMYNPKGGLIDTFTIHSGTNAPDQNRIDFSVSSGGVLTTGTITGLTSSGQAIASIDQDGTSELFQVDYSGLDIGTQSTKSAQRDDTARGKTADRMIAVSSMEMTTRIGDVLIGVIIIGVVLVLFVAGCLAFGWFGCGG